MALEALRSWASGKLPFLAFYAQWAAVTAPDCFEVCQLAQSEKLYILVRERVAPNRWLRFYRGGVNVMYKAWTEHERIDPCPAEVTDAYRAAHKAWTAKRGKFIIGAKANREVEGRLGSALENWNYQLLEGSTPVTSIESFDDVHPAFTFAFRVHIPVQLIWGISSVRLYREARLGNPQSIGRLCRLDPVVLEDRRIRMHYREIKRSGGKNADILNEELIRDTSRLITLKNMKVLLAAQVVKLSKAMERELQSLAERVPGMKIGRIRFEEPEMRQLFDAVAQDFHGQEIDTDIPDSPEAFSKALQRAQRFWPIY